MALSPALAQVDPAPATARRIDAAPPADPLHAARPPLVHSDTLLRGHRAIEISHNGVLYRLQATRLGKLILTK
jgi:hemin uptake protein HemP